MHGFPLVERPCPVADRLATMLDGDHCRHCDSPVLDLDAMPQSARLSALATTIRPCVRYRRPAAWTLAALPLIATPAAAQVAPAPPTAPSAGGQDIIVGGAPLITAAERARLKRAARAAEREERRQAHAAAAR